jgi:hypothetical protein
MSSDIVWVAQRPQLAAADGLWHRKGISAEQIYVLWGTYIGL